MEYQDFEESHINRRSNTKKQKKKITIIFKVLQLLTYNPYLEIQKCHCRDKVLQPLTKLKIGKTIFWRYFLLHYNFLKDFREYHINRREKSEKQKKVRIIFKSFATIDAQTKLGKPYPDVQSRNATVGIRFCNFWWNKI